MARQGKPLTPLEVKTAPPGRHCDGGATSLYLLVRTVNGKLRRYWIFRYTPRGGKMREMGLGRADGPNSMSLAAARDKARDLHQRVRKGGDPLEEDRAKNAREKASKALEAAKTMTFDECATAYIKAKEEAWGNAKHRQQWVATLATYASPVIGSLPVADIDTGLVLKILEPIWGKKRETASRLRGRIESVLDYARVKGWRTGENPALWRGHLEHSLASRPKAEKHHAAMPYHDVPAFMQSLRGRGDMPALALQCTILTAARSGEVLGATWGEIDLAKALWTVPENRMKAGKEHRVPLSGAALDMFERLPRIEGEDRLFPVGMVAMTSLLKRMGVEATVHGFRSSFRDFAGEETHFSREVAEAALAHKSGDKAEHAYRRGDALEKRRKLMQAWADFCERPKATGEVISIQERKNVL